MNVTLTTGENIDCHDEPFKEGGQAKLYLSRDRQRVIKIYKEKYVTSAYRPSLEQIINGRHNLPRNTPHAAHLFAWPDGIVERVNGAPQLGVIMPFVPGQTLDRQVRPNYWYNQVSATEKGPGWTRRVMVCYRLALAVKYLHQTGLCHSDLSYYNVLADMVASTAIVIDCDGLVVEGVNPPKVGGTPGFMAPEIVKSGHAIDPSIYTDRWSLAVIIYWTLLLRDPLDGPKRFPHIPSEEEEVVYKQGEGALYIEHPTDQSNRPPAREFPWTSEILTSRVAGLFRQTFVDGLEDPERRPQAHEWEGALKRLADRMVNCPNRDCLMHHFILPEKHHPVCPWCGTPFGATQRVVPLLRLYYHRGGRYRDDDWDIVGQNNRPIYQYHTDINIDPDTAGLNANRQMARIDFNGGRWLLTNTSDDRVFKELNHNTLIRPGHSHPLVDDTRILFAERPAGDFRMAHVRLARTS